MLTITMPSLKERIQDIPILCEHFIAKANRDLKTTITSISEEALAKLARHHWRGNIRELRNTIYSACLNASDDMIKADDIKEFEEAEDIQQQLHNFCLAYLQKEGVEKAHDLEQTLQKTFLHVSFTLCPNITQLSVLLNISRNTLKKQLKEFGIYETEEEK